ncbi:threonine synthase [Ornithinibacillus sp. 4-3]|uniref:Threonine synthase n=1 Tax=Ornithinibacillus sp. 4-3 TaxID=3231488 RepID=A0AB39HVT6_9BACI
MSLVCDNCHKIYKEDNIQWRCSCGSYISYKYSPSFTKEDIISNRFNMWRYDFAYPLKYGELTVTYNEGLTPLVNVPTTKCRLRAKLDNLMPTSSFKDRGTVMVVNSLIKHNVQKITEDSSGNAGASVAAYCALANIQSEIYVPKGTSIGKLAQIQAYGALIHEIEGNREDVAAAAQKDSESYAGHNWHPLFIQGTKSLAYEIWEQNNFESPKNIISVAGNGSAILGIYYGFKELLDNRQISNIPRLFVVQAKNCNPIYREFFNIGDPLSFSNTIAEGIALSSPNKGSQVVAAVRNTAGQVLDVSEEEIISAVKELATKGFYVEPTSAAAYAGICQLVNEGTFQIDDDVVMMISGDGLKASSTISKMINETNINF